jgi:hypothetical protein
MMAAGNLMGILESVPELRKILCNDLKKLLTRAKVGYTLIVAIHIGQVALCGQCARQPFPASNL